MFDWQRSFEEGSFEDESGFEQNNLETIDPLKSQANGKIRIPFRLWALT